MKEIKVSRAPKSLIGMIIGLLVAAGITAFGEKFGIDSENLFKYTILAWFGWGILLVIIVTIIAVTEKKRNYIADTAEYYLRSGRYTKREALKKAREDYKEEKWIEQRFLMYYNQGERIDTSSRRAREDYKKLTEKNKK